MSKISFPLAALIFVTAFGVCSPAWAKSLIPGSFESGADAPEGWVRKGDGEWAQGDAHGGKRFLHGRAKNGEVVWESTRIKVDADTDYRLEAWLRGPGKGDLRIEILDQWGAVVIRTSTPAVNQAMEWRYTAVEFNVQNGTSLRVQFCTEWQADLDDLMLSPVATSYMGNKGVEADGRGRITFWNEEKIATLLPGRQAGKGIADTAVYHGGKSSLQLNATGDWYAWTSIGYGAPAWADRYQFSCWAYCEKDSSAQILAVWVDDMQRVKRVDQSKSVNNSDWTLITLTTENVPDGAASVRLVAVSRGGRVWFDDFDLLRLKPRKHVARILLNEVGLNEHASHTSVIATNYFPDDKTTIEVARYHPKLPEVAIPFRSPVCVGRIHSSKADDWGWYFWTVDIYRGSGPPLGQLEVQKPENLLGDSLFDTKKTTPVRTGPGLLLSETAQNAVNFFYIQRCGYYIPGWHTPCHLDDAKLPDGQHLNATGGWHSAGDYNKLMYEHGDGGVAYALLSAYRANPQVFDKYDRDRDGLPDILDEARWGADFVAKMQIPATGGLRNHLHQGPGRNWTKWSAPEKHTDNIIGTADDPVITPGEGQSPLAIGAWAMLAPILEKRGIKTDYVDRAIRLWNHATKNGDQVNSPHLLLSALELHRTTKQDSYLKAARRAVESLLAQQTMTGRMRGAFGTYGAIPAAALAQFALDHPEDSLTPKTKEALANFIVFCTSTANNPFGIAQQPVKDVDYFYPPGMGMGNNFEILGRAWAAALVYRLSRDPAALRFAVDQMDWVLGKNPYGLCMFEGKGQLNPPRYHHRYNMIPGHERGAVPGCVPNGFLGDLALADRPGFDMSRGGNRSPSFRTSEPWLVHNLYFLLAVSAIDQAVKTTPR